MGLSILKHMHDLSDEDLRALGREPLLPAVLRRGGLPVQDDLRPLVADPLAPADGGRVLAALIHESLAVATRTGAAKPADFVKAIVDTTVRPKAVAFPTDAKLTHRARERLVRLARKTGVELRQS
jgi:IS5 family transposase